MDPYLAQIMLFGGSFVPRGWAICKGMILAISGNEALFSLLGTVYSGDGRTTFALPKIDPPVDGTRYVIAVDGTYPSRG